MKFSAGVIIFLYANCLFGQSITPSFRAPKESAIAAEMFANGTSKIPTWLFPFRSEEGALAKEYDENGKALAALNNAILRPGLGQSGSSVYVEMLSYVPKNNILRFGIGINMAKTDLKDSTKSAQELAFQKLTNGGGNIILTFSRPLIFFPSGKAGFGVLNFELAPFADVEKINEDVYNPGWGVLINTSFDYRLWNTSDGNLFRAGLLARYQYSLVNEKYRQKYNVDDQFNNFGVASLGGYLGFAMFNFQATYNAYNKSGTMFDERKFILRVEIIPVKF